LYFLQLSILQIKNLLSKNQIKLKNGEFLTLQVQQKFINEVFLLAHMGFKTTRAMGGGRVDVSLHRNVGEVLTEVEVALALADKNKNFDSNVRKKIEKSLKSASGAVAVYTADNKDKLTSAEVADLQLFQRNLKEVASKVLVEKDTNKLRSRVQALRVELDDLLE